MNVAPDIESEETGRRCASVSWSLWAGGLLLGALGWYVTWQIMSYATGQDPRIYLYLADAIRERGYSLDAIARVTNWVVPGYPLLLAAVMDTLGIFAAYWINLPLFFLGIPPLAILLRRMAGAREAGLIMLAAFWIILTGHPLNPHFLFLPFRGVIEWTFMFALIAIMQPALDRTVTTRSRMTRAVIAALLTMAGIVFRETIAFTLVPFGLLLAWAGVRGDRGAWKTLAVLAAPILLAFAAFAAWRLAEGELLNSQARAWMKSMLAGGKFSPFTVLLADILRLIRDEMRPYGLVFLGVGILLALWRREKTVFVLVVVSLLLVLFYAMWKSHVRYTLSSVGLLALVAAWGFAALVNRLCGCLPLRWNRALFSLVMGMVAGLNVHAISRMETWGPRVARSDLERLMHHPVAEEPFVFVEKDHRYLVDALDAFTDTYPRDPVDQRSSITNYTSGLFVEAIDDRGRFSTQEGVKGGDWLRQHFDLEPAGLDFHLGDSAYATFRITPFGMTNLVLGPLANDDGNGGVLWLDFKAGDARGVAQVMIPGPEYGPPPVSYPVQPAGLVPVWIPPGISNATVTVWSDVAMTAHPDPEFTPAGKTRWFTLEQGRRPSVRAMLGDGFDPDALRRKHGGSFTTNAVVRIPVPAGAEGSRAWVSFRFVPRPSVPEAIEGTVTGMGDTMDAVAWTIKPGRAHHTVTVEAVLPEGADILELAMVITNRPSGLWYLRVEHLGLAFAPTAQEAP